MTTTHARRCMGLLRTASGDCTRKARTGRLTCHAHRTQEERCWTRLGKDCPDRAAEIRQAAGCGASLEYVGKDADGRPVFAGYWDDGAPVVMVGEPGRWFEAWSDEMGDDNEGLWRATLAARKIVLG